jgi:hypothetical protein
MLTLYMAYFLLTLLVCFLSFGSIWFLLGICRELCEPDTKRQSYRMRELGSEDII